MSAMVWDLFGISANNDVPDADGCIWTVESSEGWDAPDQRTGTVSPTALHGQVLVERFAEGRPVVIRGLIHGPDQTTAWKAYDRATSAMPGLLGSGAIKAYEPTPKMLTVGQFRPPRVKKPSGGWMAYELSLLAEYPWKVALADESPVTILGGGSQTFTGGGNWPAEIVVTTTSSGTVDLEAGGLALTSGTVPSGTVFDSRDFTVTGPGGVDLFSALIPGFQWPAVTPASNTFVQSGTANLALVRRKTFA